MHSVVYRLWQVRQQLGFVAPLSAEEYLQVTQWLPASALPLFQTMSAADQRHSLRVCQGLLARGCVDKDLLAAALLHDVGKAQGRVPFWIGGVPSAMPGGMQKLGRSCPLLVDCRKKLFSIFARITNLVARLLSYIW